MPVPPLIIQSPITPAYFLLMALAALCVGQYIISLYIPRRYPRSNKRAIIGSCPPSSASTAENSPATDHGVWIAVKSGVPNATPDPSPTPHDEDSDKHTVRAQKKYWRTHSSAPSAVGHRRRVIRSPQTTSSPEPEAASTARSEPCTDRATAEPGA